MKIKEGYIPFRDFKTYYRIVNEDGKNTPLLLLHGGPGSTHNYFEILDNLANIDDRPLIMYDQIGCGKSYVDGDEDLFNADTWIDELKNIRKHLNLDKIHLLGQSWGGMLAIWYAIEHKPSGIKSYILSSTLSSAKLWKEEQHRYISYMPADMQAAIKKAEDSGNFGGEDYKRAVDEFMLRHCSPRFDESYPECIRREKKRGDKAYTTAWGPNEFTPTGTLSHYDFTERLGEIKEATLVISGAMDMSTPYIAKTMYDNLSDSSWELFRNSRHVPYIEENEKYIDVLSKWLRQND